MLPDMLIPTNVYFESNQVEKLDTKTVIKGAKCCEKDPIKEMIGMKLKTVHDLRLDLALRVKVCHKG